MSSQSPPSVITPSGMTHNGARHNPNLHSSCAHQLNDFYNWYFEKYLGQLGRCGCTFYLFYGRLLRHGYWQNQAAWHNNLLLLTPHHTTINCTLMPLRHRWPSTSQYVQQCRTVHFTVSFKTYTAKGYLEYKYITFYYRLFHTALYNRKYFLTLHKDLNSFLSKATTFETTTNN